MRLPWSLADNHGSIRDVVDNNGNPVDHVAYATFGQIVYESNPAIPRWEGYAAQHLSAASGLMLSGARWYDPATGRWLSQDPTGFAGQDSDLSRYVGNDPTNATDPSGDLSTTQVAAMIVFPWMTPAILAMEAARATQASASKAAAEASMSHALDDYANWFNSWSAGKALSNAMAPGITSMLGEQYLAGASDGELVGITALGVTAGVVGGMAGTALAGAAGLSGYGAAAAAGAIGGGAEYLGWTVGGQAISGGQSADPSLVGLATSMAGGAAGGVLGKGATDLGGAVLNEIPCNWGGNASCFVGGTRVLVPGEPATPALSARAEHIYPEAGQSDEHRWLGSVLLAGVGIAGFAATRSRSPDKEKKKRDAAMRALFSEQSENNDVELHVNPDSDTLSRGIDALCDALFHGEESAGLLLPVRNSPEASAPSGKATIVAPCAQVPRLKRSSRETTGSNRAIATHKQKHQQAVKSRFGTIWLVACLALAGFFGLRPPSPPDHVNIATSASALRNSPRHASRPIDDIRVGQRVLGENPDLAESQHTTRTAIEPRTWRLVKMHAEERWNDGTLDTIEVESLQPPDWLRDHRARRGAFVPLPIDLTEMGLSVGLRARVEAIERCPEIAAGPGHVVMSTVSHLNRFLFDLELMNDAGQAETVTTTGYHKFYSASRRGWVSACELRRGEQLRGADRPLTVSAVTRIPGVERVYNFSVEGEHVYHVSALGALVHNPDCLPPSGGGDTLWPSGGDGPGPFNGETWPPAPPYPPGTGPLPPDVGPQIQNPWNWPFGSPPDNGVGPF